MPVEDRDAAAAEIQRRDIIGVEVAGVRGQPDSDMPGHRLAILADQCVLLAATL